jgi:hypothetical protein
MTMIIAMIQPSTFDHPAFRLDRKLAYPNVNRPVNPERIVSPTG